MKKFILDFILTVIYTTIVMVIAGYTHERDIVNSCKDKGYVTKSTWSVDTLYCSEMKKSEENE
jgi:hypothetical protein